MTRSRGVDVAVTHAPTPLVLLVADEHAQASTARVLATYFTVASASSLFGARALLSGVRFDVVVVAGDLMDGNGAELLAELERESPTVGRVLLSGAETAHEDAAQLCLPLSVLGPDLVDAIRALVTRAERRTSSGTVPRGTTPRDDD